MLNTRKSYLFPLILTLALHGLLWVKVEFKPQEIKPPRRLIVQTFRTVGKEDSNKKGFKLQDRDAGKKQPDQMNRKGKKGKLSLADLNDIPTPRPSANNLVRKSGLKSMFMNKQKMRNFLKNSSASVSSKQLLKELGDNDINIKFEVPKGVKLDELNKAELQFYSFQRRTAINYVNTFYRNLNDFNTQNPHLEFPMVNKPERMTGRVTYDLNGNIVRIKMVRWTEEEKLQDFFLEILQDLNKLPNPPKAIVKDGEFTIYYSLNINR
jgi:hypothetical protein